MQSIILIGNEKFHIDNIAKITHKHSTNNYKLDTGRYVVEFENGHVFYDFINDLINEYEEDELAKIPFEKPKFISMSYTSEELMRNIILQVDFLKGIYVDNDHGRIMPIEEFVKLLRF